MNFEFTFDNSADLPKGPGYQLGQRIYVIADDSTAINNSTNIIYKYSSGKWTKTLDKATSTSITNTITENGSYSIASNIATGTGNINVDISGEEFILIDKTITANGEYLPASDEATAYSKVVVDVDTTFTNIVSSFMLNNDTEAKRIVFMRSDNGVYDIPTPSGNPDDTPSVWVLVDPVVSFKMPYPGGSITFTPSNNFDNIYGGNDKPVSYTGDTLVPGDGKAYSYRPSMGGDTLKKSSYNFYFSIT